MEILSKDSFEALSNDEKIEIIDEAEWHAFLPPRGE